METINIHFTFEVVKIIKVMKKSGFKSFVFITLLSFSVLQSFAQYQISGKIMQKNEKKSPLSLANVELRTADSVYVNGITGDVKGNFRFKHVAAGNYRITISYLGFSPQTIALNGLSKSVNLRNIFMEESVNQLKSVMITGRRCIWCF